MAYFNLTQKLDTNSESLCTILRRIRFSKRRRHFIHFILPDIAVIWMGRRELSTHYTITLYSECFIHYRKYILQITQPSQYRCTQLQYRFAVISEAPSMYDFITSSWTHTPVSKCRLNIYRDMYLHIALRRVVATESHATSPEIRQLSK